MEFETIHEYFILDISFNISSRLDAVFKKKITEISNHFVPSWILYGQTLELIQQEKSNLSVKVLEKR